MYLAWFSGRYDEGLQPIRRIVTELSDTGHQPHFHLAWGLAWVGRRDEAIAAAALAMAGSLDDAVRWLEHAVDIGCINYPFLTEKDPFLEILRVDPRFQQLMVRVKQEWEEFEV